MPSKPDDLPVTARARRARIGGLTARQAARYAGVRVANVGRSPWQRELAMEKRHLDAADQILAVLGTMKGPVMKMGQILSFIDLGFLPEQVRPRFQARLAALRDGAPAVPFASVEPVLVAELGGPLNEVFAAFDPTPVGIASIGQVYRASMHDGREVAVKVQYPGIRSATQTDLKLLSFALRFAKTFLPGIDMDDLAAELTDRISEELDYVREAHVHKEIAAAYADHPFIVVPRVVDELSGPLVLVTEYVEGTDFAQLCTAPDEVRDRAAEIMVRFYFGSIFQSGRFSGDPHPGNIKALPNGSLAFFDFGSSAQLDKDKLELLVGTFRAVDSDDGDAARRLLTESAVLNRPDSISDGEVLSFVRDTLSFFFVDDDIRLDPRTTSELILQNLSFTTRYADALRGQRLPTEWSLTARTTLATLALLGQMHASANWHRIAREWIYGEAPTTDLGIIEAAFRSGARQKFSRRWPDGRAPRVGPDR